MLWDFSIKNDHIIEPQRPDLFVVNKKRRTCKVIDFAVSRDSSIENKEKENVEKYQDLKRELQKIWNVRVKIIPLVVGALGAIPKRIVRDSHDSRNRASSENSFIRNGYSVKKGTQNLRMLVVA